MKRIQSVPLVIGQFIEMIDANYGIVSSTGGGSNFHVRVLRCVWIALRAQRRARCFNTPRWWCAGCAVQHLGPREAQAQRLSGFAQALARGKLRQQCTTLLCFCGLAHTPHPAQVVDVLPPEADSSIRTMQMTEKPDVTYEVRCGL